MSAEQLEYVNNPGRTLNPQKRSGLGIPLCHEIAKLHKAALHFTSEADKGTQAVISFTIR
jgi:signal transduction histidine kinase